MFNSYYRGYYKRKQIMPVDYAYLIKYGIMRYQGQKVMRFMLA